MQSASIIMSRNKYLFFYLKTGNGHYAPAKALANEISRLRSSEVEPILVDGLSPKNKLAKKMLVDGYSYSSNKAMWLYELLYAMHKLSFVSWLSSFIVSLITYPHIKRQILEQKPEKIVILHFFLIAPIYRVLRKYGLNTEVSTIVTDPYTAHPIWFLNKTQKFIVFSEQVRNMVLKHGISEDQVNVFPFIVDERYTSKLSEEEKNLARAELGIPENKKLILIIGGGHGIPKGYKIAKRIVRHNPNVEIAFVCGHNNALYRKLLKFKREVYADNLHLFEYVDFVHTLINVSDVVITKCGASTFMEILFSEKVQIICNYIWEQEKGNMEFVKNNKMGLYQKRISKLPDVVNELLSNGQLYSSFVENIEKHGFANGTSQVAEHLAGIKQ